MIVPASSTDDTLVLDFWLNLLQRKQASVSGDDFQRLYFYGKDQGFFPSPEKTFSKEIWSKLGDHMLQILSAGYDADMVELVMFWKRCYTVLASYGTSSCSSAGDPSSLDSEAGGKEKPLSIAKREPSPPSQAAALGDVSVPGNGFGSTGVDGVPSQLVPANRQMGRNLRVSGDPAELAVPTPPLPAPRRRKSGREPPSLSAFLAVGRDGESLAPPAPLLELDSVTTQCPHCGVAMKFSLGAAEAREGGVLIDSLSDPVPVGRVSVSLHTARAAPAVGFRVTGRAVLGVAPAAPLPALPPPGVAGGADRSAGASPGSSGPALCPTPAVVSSTPALPEPAPPPPSKPSAAARGGAADCQAAPLPASRSLPVLREGSRGPAPFRPTSGSCALPGPTAGPTSLPSPPTNAGAAASASPVVSTFGTGGDTTVMRPVPPWGRGSRGDGSSSAGLWTLPPCQVTVPPRDHTRFWGDVKAKVKEMADYDSAHHPLEGRDGFSSPAGATETAVVSGSVAVPSSQASAPVPVKSMGWDLAGTAAFPGSYQPFLVLRGATHGTHQALSWEAFKELRDVVGKYGLGSAEVMQVLRGFNADVLPPYVIRYLARVLFQPVEYDIFEYKWTRLAGRVVARNTALSQQDPRRVIGTDVLLGMGNFADLQRQVALDPLVLDQCQKTGMAALIQTIEMAYPKEPFVTVVQGAEEPFLQFAGRLAASVEGQVEDVNVRLLVLKDLARTNCNAECKMIIEALPGDPSLPQMVEACARVGATGCKVAATATALQMVWTGPQGGQQKQGNAQASKKQEKKVQRGTNAACFCSRCGGPNHAANVCRATAHVNGQPLLSSGNGKQNTKGRRAQTQASLQAPEPMERLQPAPAAQQVLMSAQQQWSS
ncbi:uncharacterized protein LOC120748768 [Hirundo rustica]|uniref:uncharacterized protein LOC120748768 n=1 Tax=Hirundo rustica TaxID=43150 RepID=UPI001A94C0CF|nr:uncharacterized protein LOC120748768 [Hirundo rustica]XP_039911481.1 uncharacterized protein LOC120748768 [Hirundo rustica]